MRWEDFRRPQNVEDRRGQGGGGGGTGMVLFSGATRSG
jgi:predicted metalloprotease